MNVTQDLSILALVWNASVIVQLVIALLLVVSFMSWYFIFHKLFTIRRARGQTEQVDRLPSLERLTRHERLESAGEQELADQIVELGDVARDAGAKLRALVASEQLDRDADSREWRAQLVRSRRERGALRGDELLHPFRRPL